MSISPQRVIVPMGESLPPPIPGVRHVWLFRWGTLVSDDDVRRRVDRFFYWPMIVLGIAVLPLMVIDCMFIYETRKGAEVTARTDWLWWLVIIGLTIIWIAFAVEFAVKIAIAESRLEYLRRNWLDVVIILIPVLRPLRVAYVARTARVFALRGVGFKVARFVFTLVVGLETTESVLQRLGMKKRIKGRLEPDHMTRYQLIDEVKRLRQTVDAWNAWHLAEQAYLEQQDQRSFEAPMPIETDGAASQVTPTDRESSPYNPADANRPGAAQPDHR